MGIGISNNTLAAGDTIVGKDGVSKKVTSKDTSILKEGDIIFSGNTHTIVQVTHSEQGKDLTVIVDDGVDIDGKRQKLTVDESSDDYFDDKEKNEGFWNRLINRLDKSENNGKQVSAVLGMAGDDQKPSVTPDAKVAAIPAQKTLTERPYELSELAPGSKSVGTVGATNSVDENGVVWVNPQLVSMSEKKEAIERITKRESHLVSGDGNIYLKDLQTVATKGTIWGRNATKQDIADAKALLGPESLYLKPEITAEASVAWKPSALAGMQVPTPTQTTAPTPTVRDSVPVLKVQSSSSSAPAPAPAPVSAPAATNPPATTFNAKTCLEALNTPGANSLFNDVDKGNAITKTGGGGFQDGADMNDLYRVANGGADIKPEEQAAANWLLRHPDTLIAVMNDGKMSHKTFTEKIKIVENGVLTAADSDHFLKQPEGADAVASDKQAGKLVFNSKSDSLDRFKIRYQDLVAMAKDKNITEQERSAAKWILNNPALMKQLCGNNNDFDKRELNNLK
ncbi:hypothetical protein QN362_15625 [Actimicrobium sp. CCC2.4]|uniref:hypothetical protein n=1 Tax=Actimicrobium sp. CCC2.4 TaxID=3048606 RepID=UPI002B249277|nr:hypothetical protein [Actimicrobium sp. CCC2.4]MEB0136767.1 hypothetical protein [Actimicrobium sp. CCC2.4]